MDRAPVVLLKSSLGSQGGLEKVCFRLAKGLIARGHPVTILTSTSPKKPLPAIEGVTIIPLLSMSPFSFINALFFDAHVKKWLQKHPHEIVFGFDRNSFQTHIRAGNGCHAAYLKLRRENFFRFLVNPLHHTLLRLEKKGFENPKLKRLITNSHLVKEQILSHYKTDPQKITVLHNGVEWDEFEEPFQRWPEERKRLLAHWGIPSDHFVLLFAGHGFKRKGLPLLLDALKEFPFVSLLVVGKDKKKYPPQNNVHYFGGQPSLIPFLQAADALAIPSLYDPFANVTVEALAMGLFVCSSKTNGGSEVLTNESGVIIEDLFNKEAFKQALQVTLAHPKTKNSAENIRKSVQSLDYRETLTKMMDLLHAQ